MHISHKMAETQNNRIMQLKVSLLADIFFLSVPFLQVECVTKRGDLMLLVTSFCCC